MYESNRERWNIGLNDLCWAMDENGHYYAAHLLGTRGFTGIVSYLDDEKKKSVLRSFVPALNQTEVPLCYLAGYQWGFENMAVYCNTKGKEKHLPCTVEVIGAEKYRVTYKSGKSEKALPEHFLLQDQYRPSPLVPSGYYVQAAVMNVALPDNLNELVQADLLSMIQNFEQSFSNKVGQCLQNPDGIRQDFWQRFYNLRDVYSSIYWNKRKSLENVLYYYKDDMEDIFAPMQEFAYSVIHDAGFQIPKVFYDEYYNGAYAWAPYYNKIHEKYKEKVEDYNRRVDEFNNNNRNLSSFSRTYHSLTKLPGHPEELYRKDGILDTLMQGAQETHDAIYNGFMRSVNDYLGVRYFME